MSIYNVNQNNTLSNKIKNINDMVIEVNGKVEQGKFDVNELTQFLSDANLNRKFKRNQLLGNTLSTYTDWSHVISQDGYSIWKLAPTDYTYNTVNKLYFDDKLLTAAGQATSETVIGYDKVYIYDGGAESGGVAFTDNTTEAATENGTAFSLMDATTDYLYVGDAATFTGVAFDFSTRGSNYTLVAEYYDGSAWTELSSVTDTLVDNTANFSSDGRITWGAPGDWALTTVNSVSKYWIRISTTSTPVTTATAFKVCSDQSVIDLLNLSAENIIQEEWAWCYYSNSVYVTIRNTGAAAYEGNYFITSSSSTTNKQNFFVYNHEYKSDYQDSTYVAGSSTVTADAVTFSVSGFTATDVEAAIIEVNDAVTAESLWDRDSSGYLYPQTSGDDLDLGTGGITSSDITISEATPMVAFKDTDCTDSDINAQILVVATDTGSGTEDVDVTISSQRAGTSQSWIYIDADLETVFNNDGLDQNFRVASSNNANMLFVDAGNDQVVMTSTSTTKSTLLIDANGTTGVTGEAALRVDSENTDVAACYITSANDGTGGSGFDQAALSVVVEGVGGGGRFYRNVSNATKPLVLINNIASTVGAADVALKVSSSAKASLNEASVQFETTDATGDQSVLDITQAGTAQVMGLQLTTQDVGFIDFKATADADATSAISTLTTSGAVQGHIQIEVNGVSRWIPFYADPS